MFYMCPELFLWNQFLEYEFISQNHIAILFLILNSEVDV